MTDLIVDRLHARAAVNGPDDEARVRALLTDLTGRRLDEALATSALPPGDWCVRRLDVSLALDPASGDAALGRRWARQITEALVAALADGGPEVVHFARPSDAVADLIADLALGDDRREWAWRAVGALAPSDPDPAVDPAGAALAALERDRGSAVHVLSTAVRATGLPAVHRLLAEAGWQRAAALVLAASGQPARRWLQLGPPAGDSADSADGVRGGDPTAVVAGILARSPFADAWRRGRLRPSPATARAWSVLAAAEAEPALLRRPIAELVLTSLPTAIAPAQADHAPVHAEQTPPPPPRDHAFLHGGRATPSSVQLPLIDPEPTPVTDRSSDASGRIRPSAEESPSADGVRRPPETHRSAEDGQTPARPSHPRDPVEDRRDEGFATVWGGLVHLFATAAAAGLPDEALDDEELAARPASWILFHLAHAMTGHALDGLADPATRAVAGLPPQAPVPTPEPTAAQRAQLERLADQWARVTAERLGPAGQADSPQVVVAGLARRGGAVRHSPGWIEFDLRLSDVDLDVRRAGLDLDPGFVTWLGAVVVIRYV